MNDFFETLQNAILAPNRKYALSAFRQEAEHSLDGSEPVERARLRSLVRLAYVAEGYENHPTPQKITITDLMILMRHVIRTYGRPLDIPLSWWHSMQLFADQSSIFSIGASESVVTIHAKPWRPTWLHGSAEHDIEQIKFCRTQIPVLGDGMLAAFSDGRMLTYRSEGQKRAVDAVIHAPPGSSLLVTLPTGGGKSLCILLPAWVASGGGRRQGGTTVVVVPTVSLALDQQIHVADLFRKASSPQHRPYALLGDTTPEVRSTIYQGISEGTLPLLYTSPESLLNNTRLREVLSEAATKGFLNWLVIDEAHMVEQWGAGFRTEFQLLAAYRRQLLKQSQGKLRTLLLSATIASSCQATLEGLFGNEKCLTTVFGNQLRPEITYWQAQARNVDDRRDQVVDALYHLPRPVILYVTRPEEAEEWVAFLRKLGFERIAAYSGKTAPLERTQIVREWARGERDIIVATSAFGLGIDKEDVRAVIHATMPENLDRFYQEVGRGGRDGCTSVSLVCSVIDEDYRLARSLQIRSRITVGVAWYRWQSLWQNRQVSSLNDSHYILDLDVAPTHNPEMAPSESHRNWNEHVLLLMQRGELINIIDVNPARSDEDAVPEEGDFKRRWLLIELLDASVTYGESAFRRAFEPLRQQEYHTVRNSLDQMRNLVAEYSGKRQQHTSRRCLGYQLRDIYPATAFACGGCSECRSLGYPPTAAPIIVEIDNEAIFDVASSPKLAYSVSSLFSPRLHHIVYWEGNQYPEVSLRSLFGVLLKVGFSQIIVPRELIGSKPWLTDLFTYLRNLPSIPPHRLLDDAMLQQNTLAPWLPYPWPTAVVYPMNSYEADGLYRHVRDSFIQTPLLHIIQHSLDLPSEHGKFVQKVEGRTIALTQFIDQMKVKLETI